jgi:imidazolonepropionase-like amidohydrolase
MVRYGMTPMQGIRAATIVAAECMGWDDRVGSITPGKYADFIAVAQDPFDSGLESLRALDAVIKGGELVARD